MKIVLVATTASKLGSHDTGLWLEELAAPYYEFEGIEYETIIASPTGGPIPIDAGSMGEAYFNDVCKRFMHDATAIGKLSHSVKVADVEWDSVDALYLSGGHGTCIDFVAQPALKAAVENMYKAGKVIGAVCHGVLALVDCENEDGTPFVKGKTVTGFSDSEEHAVQLQDTVPFLLETKLKTLGANYSKGNDWGSHIAVDGKLVTGQNPQSSDDVAKAMVGVLETA